MFQTVHLECHQQRSFTLKMHQNRWRLVLPPKPYWAAYSAPPDPLAGLRGPTSKGGEGRGGEGEEGGTLDSHNVGDRLTPLHFSAGYCHAFESC